MATQQVGVTSPSVVAVSSGILLLLGLFRVLGAFAPVVVRPSSAAPGPRSPAPSRRAASARRARPSTRADADIVVVASARGPGVVLLDAPFDVVGRPEEGEGPVPAEASAPGRRPRTPLAILSPRTVRMGLPHARPSSSR